MNHLNIIDKELEDYKQKLQKPQPHWPHDIRNAIICLNKNIFSLDYSVKKMKENCYIAGRNFSSRFRNYTGSTPREYITFHRIQVVKILLQEESLRDIPVNTIGFSVGYEKPAAFSMIFKKQTGVSPNPWRIEKCIKLKRKIK